MSITPSTVIATARDLLQDTVSGAYRYSDDSLYRALNEAFREAKRLRPDLFFWDNTINAPPTINGGNVATPISIDDQFENAFVLFIAGYAELRDDQFTNDGRAATLLTQFRAALTGG